MVVVEIYVQVECGNTAEREIVTAKLEARGHEVTYDPVMNESYFFVDQVLTVDEC